LSTIDKKALKEALLDLIKEDRELRYMLLGALGFRELLERFSRLEERQQKLEERQLRLEEEFRKLEERFARIEERQQKLEERFAQLEERFARIEERQQELEKHFAKLEERFTRLEERYQELEERYQRLEERVAKLEERFAQLEERFAKLEERFAQLEERVTRLEERVTGLERRMDEFEVLLKTVAHRFGVLSEEAFREAMKGILEEYFGATAEHWTTYDEEGYVYDHPSEVEVDVVIKDGVHILVEVKSRVDTGDVLELSRIGELYQKKTGYRPQLVIVGGFVSEKARKKAGPLGIRIYTYLERSTNRR